MSESAWTCTRCHLEGERPYARLDIHDRLICLNCQDGGALARCECCHRYYEDTKGHYRDVYMPESRVCLGCAEAYHQTCSCCSELYLKESGFLPFIHAEVALCQECVEYAEADEDSDDEFAELIRLVRAELANKATWVALLAAGQLPLPGLEDIAYRPIIAA